jgi:hypothetical protein
MQFAESVNRNLTGFKWPGTTFAQAEAVTPSGGVFSLKVLICEAKFAPAAAS